MEKCKYCQAELEENSTVCPACGKDNAEPAVEVQNMTPETVDTAEAPAEEKSKGVLVSPGKLAAAAAVFVVLVAVIVALLVSGKNGKQEADAAQPTGETAAEATEAPTIPADGNPDDATCKGTYYGEEADVLGAAGKVVARAGDFELTNEQLQVFYWTEVWQFLSNYGSYAEYFGLDVTQSLDTQACGISEGLTWQQFFLDNALERWRQSQMLAAEADRDGFKLDAESQNNLDNTLATLNEMAASNGMQDAAALLKDRMGCGATPDAYMNLQTLQFRGYNYLYQREAEMTPSEQEIADYFAANESEYIEQGVTKDSFTVNVRHILVMPKQADPETISDEEWAACEADAQKILDQWLEGEKTEERFAALANEFSEDPGSNTNGGLYEGVYQGQMVEAFNDWCFDSARKIGDYGIVTTSYGCHVMFFSGTETVWQDYAKQDLLDEKLENLLNEMGEGYPLHVEYGKILLGNVTIQ